MTKSPPLTRSVPLLHSFHWLPVRFRIMFKISLMTYKTPNEKQPVYVHPMLAASLPSRSWRLHKDNSLSVYRVKTNTEPFTLVPLLIRNNLRQSVLSAISVASFKKHLKAHLLDLAFPLRHRNAWYAVDFTELFLRFCCWTLIQLSHHWAWLCWGYWHYRNLIDWLIDWTAHEDQQKS